MPLPRQAIELLTELRPLSKGSFLFAGVRSPSRPISDGTLNAALRRLGYTKDEARGHGFRATASSLLNESGKWHPDATERQVAQYYERLGTKPSRSLWERSKSQLAGSLVIRGFAV
jgi:integrase